MKEYGCCPKFKRGDNSTYLSHPGPPKVKKNIEM
jgi:hypothetical protein